ncbi:MAG: STAS domain-containing protein [Pseudomonadota bacterium]
MKTKTRMINNAFVVSLEGEVDLATSPTARKEILRALQEGDTYVDLAAVSYMDSSGVASLVEGYQLAKDKGRRFGLVGVAHAVRLVLELASLDKVFPMYERVPGAD